MVAVVAATLIAEAGIKVLAVAAIDQEDIEPFLPPNVAVDFVGDDEAVLIGQIAQQLPAGTPMPRLRLRLRVSDDTVATSAQSIADYFNELVVISDFAARVLAHCIPLSAGQPN
jgi:hypothetical protein